MAITKKGHGEPCPEEVRLLKEIDAPRFTLDAHGCASFDDARITHIQKTVLTCGADYLDKVVLCFGVNGVKEQEKQWVFIWKAYGISSEISREYAKVLDVEVDSDGIYNVTMEVEILPVVIESMQSSDKKGFWEIAHDAEQWLRRHKRLETFLQVWPYVLDVIAIGIATMILLGR